MVQEQQPEGDHLQEGVPLRWSREWRERLVPGGLWGTASHHKGKQIRYFAQLKVGFFCQLPDTIQPWGKRKNTRGSETV